MSGYGTRPYTGTNRPAHGKGNGTHPVPLASRSTFGLGTAAHGTARPDRSCPCGASSSLS